MKLALLLLCAISMLSFSCGNDTKKTTFDNDLIKEKPVISSPTPANSNGNSNSNSNANANRPKS